MDDATNTRTENTKEERRWLKDRLTKVYLPSRYPRRMEGKKP